MSETTANDFLARLRQANIASETTIKGLEDQGPFETGKAAALQAIEQKVVTVWQARRLLSGTPELKLGRFVLCDRIVTPSGCQLYRAHDTESDQPFWIEWEPKSRTTRESIEAAQGVSATCFLAPIEVVELGDGRLMVYKAVEGSACLNEKNKTVRLDRLKLSRVLRDLAEGLQSLHASGQTWGRMHPSQLYETEQGYQLGRWGSWSTEGLEEDPFYVADLAAHADTAGSGDIASLGRMAMLLGFGTVTAAKVTAKSRLDKLILRMAAPSEEQQRPSAEQVTQAIDDWFASKSAVEPSNSKASPTEDSAALLPSVVTDDSIVSVSAVPLIETEEAVAAKVNPQALQIRSPEFRQRNMWLTYGAYGFSSLVVLVGTIVALFFVLNAQNKPEVAEAESKAKVKEVVDEIEAEIDEGDAPAAPITDEDPAPLIELDFPIEENPADNPPPIDPLKQGDNIDVLIDPVTEPEVVVDPMPEPEMKDDPETVANNDTTPAPEVKPAPTTTEPTEPEKPYVPAFKDLPKAVTLPEVGQGDWKNEVVLGTIHLQAGDLLFTELKGKDKAFRENASFEISNADGGTAQYAFDIVSVVGGKRTRIAKLDAEGGTLKFRYYDEAEDAPAANYLRNCHLRMRTGTDVGGIALRVPAKISPLTIAERTVDATSDTVMSYLPNPESIKMQVLPLSDKFPDYGFEDNKKVDQATRGTINIIFGGKYKEAMFLQLKSQLRNKLTLSVKAFSLVGGRPRPFKGDELAKGMEQAKALATQLTEATKRMDKIPKEQRPKNFNTLRQASEVQKKQAEAIVKQSGDTLNFVDGMTGQVLPVGVYYEAEEFKVYLATPSGQPLDD